jgi:hypothetical protein
MQLLGAILYQKGLMPMDKMVNQRLIAAFKIKKCWLIVPWWGGENQYKTSKKLPQKCSYY